jgi:hypothetical protein
LLALPLLEEFHIDLGFPQLCETAQNRALANAEARRQLGKRRRTEREIALEFVEQAEFEGVVHRHLRSQCAQRAW